MVFLMPARDRPLDEVVLVGSRVRTRGSPHFFARHSRGSLAPKERNMKTKSATVTKANGVLTAVYENEADQRAVRCDVTCDIVGGSVSFFNVDRAWTDDDVMTWLLRETIAGHKGPSLREIEIRIVESAAERLHLSLNCHAPARK